MKKGLQRFILVLIVLSGVGFILYNFKRSSPPPQVAQTPPVAAAPARIYGIVEPAGREVFVSPTVTRRVTKIYVKEGAAVKEGQLLCSLECSVEQAEYNSALSKAVSARKVHELSDDTLRRNRNLYENQVISEYEFTQARLKEEVDSVNFIVADREADLAKAKLDQLELKSPIGGKVYKFDVRLGETLASGDNTRITLGPEGLWVRLYLESFWMNRVKTGDHYRLYDSETNEYIGLGQVIERAPYLGGRESRTEDVRERSDIKFQEVVLTLQPAGKNVPLGLSVVASLSEGEKP